MKANLVHTNQAIRRAIAGLLGSLLLVQPVLAQAQPSQKEPAPVVARTMGPLGGTAPRVWTLDSIDPAADTFADLAPLTQAIGDARIVALGEQTHGAREEYLLKLRLLRYLYEKLGFEVLLLESGFYDVGRLAGRMSSGEPLDGMAPGNIFFMYSKSAEGRLLLQYLDQQRARGTPLQLAGIDSQHTGELSQHELLPRLRAHLQQHHAALALDTQWQPFAAPAQALVAMQRKAPDTAEQAAFYRQGAALRDALCRDASAQLESDAWWCQVVASLESQAHSYWSNGQDYQRDNQMGANAIWLADHQFAGKKAVVWAHTVHVARGFQRTASQLQAGEVMSRHWGERYKVVHFSTTGGAILDYATLQAQVVAEPAPDSLEARLGTDNGSVLGVFASAALDLPQYGFEYQVAGLETGHPAGRLGANWDVLFLLPKVSPVTMVR